MFYSTLLVFSLPALAAAFSNSSFEAHVKSYGLRFQSDEDEAIRRAIFEVNADLIEQHNAQQNDYTLKLNEFAHLTQDEFAQRFTGLRFPTAEERASSTMRVTAHNLASFITAKDAVDWAVDGAVTGIKNQGSCGSCWSFSTTGSLEGAYFLKTGTLKAFSEQQLVSCDTSTDQGCSGGLMDSAFDFIKKNGGLCTEDDWPYTAKNGQCNNNCAPDPASTVDHYVDVSPDPQKTPAAKEDLEAAVSQQPVSVAIAASGLAFQFYHSGVLTGRCTTRLDHGVLAVGYGTEGSTDYWKIKNSPVPFCLCHRKAGII